MTIVAIHKINSDTRLFLKTTLSIKNQRLSKSKIQIKARVIILNYDFSTKIYLI